MAVSDGMEDDEKLDVDQEAREASALSLDELLERAARGAPAHMARRMPLRMRFRRWRARRLSDRSGSARSSDTAR